MVRIISIRYKDSYTTSILFNSLDIEEIVSKIMSFSEDFDEYRIIFPDLSERIWENDNLKSLDEEEE